MTHPTGGQSSQPAGDDRGISVVQHWSTVPADALREFVSELCARFTYRGAEARTGVSKTALQKLVKGETKPNHSTRRRLGETYLEFYRDGAMWKKANNGKWDLRVHLFELLPPGEEAARAELEKIFALAMRFPDEVPDSIDLIWEWMDVQIQGEYWAQRNLDSFGLPKRARKGEGARSRTAKKDPPTP